MSLRKLAALFAVFGAIIGLVGSGLGAQFVDQVTATQTISVGTFACTISSTTAGALVSGDHKSVTYSAPPIASSAASSSPFVFTVHNGGSIAQELSVATTAVPAPFSIIGAPFLTSSLASGADQTYNTGLQWTELSNANLGQTVTATWTISCDEAGAGRSVIFDNTPGAVPGNLPSYGAQAYSFNEWGGGVTFAGSARKLSTATVVMSSWACQTGGGATCVSAPGSTYSVPITFNVYNVSAGNVGTLITSKTQTFAIPYRPTSNCPTDNTAWTDGTNCFHGKAVAITFTFSGPLLPNTAIFGVTYQTQSSGYPALGTSGPTDSLNIAVYPGTSTATQASVGTWLPDDTHAYVAPRSASTMVGTAPVANMPTGAGDNFVGQEPAVQITATN